MNISPDSFIHCSILTLHAAGYVVYLQLSHFQRKLSPNSVEEGKTDTKRDECARVLFFFFFNSLNQHFNRKFSRERSREAILA